jgi:HSP20 family molecular chaperone IbpA
MRHRNLDGLFDAFFGGMQPIHLRNEIDFSDENSYSVDYTKDGAYVFFEVPGFNKNNLKVEMEDGKIFVEGKRTYKIEGAEKVKTISQKSKLYKAVVIKNIDKLSGNWTYKQAYYYSISGLVLYKK